MVGRARCFADVCPTTERDLADGVGPAGLLAAAGAHLTLGTDSHAVIDMFEEMRAVELDARLVSQRRGHWTADELVGAATTTGHASLGFPDAGAIAVGQRADLVALRRDTVRTAGAAPGEVPLVATAADVRTVVVDGRVVVADGRHALGDVGALLSAAIELLWRAS